MIKRRTLLAATLSGTTAALRAGSAFGESFPSRPIRWVMPFPAGGPTDATARKLAEIVGSKLGRPVVIDNKPGASGSIGTAEVARAAPDGYTLAIAIPDSLISVASLVKSVSYDARTDLTPVMKICHAMPVLAASVRLGVRNISELLAAARKSPGSIAYGTWGAGSLPHLVMKSLEGATGTHFLDVPYKGLAPIVQDLLGGAVHLALMPAPLTQQLQEKGAVVPLATTGGQRVPIFPHVASMQEQGVDTPIMRSTLWTGLVGPKGMPEPLLRRWIDVLNESVRTPEFEKYMATAGQIRLAQSGAAFGRELAEEYVATNSLIKSLGIQPQ